MWEKSLLNNLEIIIFHKHSSDWRLKNLVNIILYLKSIYNFNITIVEQDKKEIDSKKIKELNVKYLFDYYDKNNYNKSRAYNLGARNTKCQTYCFHDSDILIESHIYKFCSKFFDKFQVITPYNKVINLNEYETKRFYSEKQYTLPIGKLPREKDGNYTNVSGGIVFFNRDAFWDIGGWDERFEGWGGEDDQMNDKINKCLTLKIFKSISLHLYHEINRFKTSLNKNDKILEECRKMSKEEILKAAKHES